MYEIALFTSEWDHDIMLDLLQGVRWFLAGIPDARVYVISDINCFRDGGMFQPSLFDAIVIQGNSDWKVSSRQLLADRARAQGVPIVSINYPLEGCHCVGTDNRGAMRELAEHLMVEHEARSFVFVTGPQGSSEARRREEGFWDACREHGIPEESVTIMVGSWQEESGAAVGETILDNLADLPDAIMCSNDRSAVGLATVLQQDGVRIPEDVLVTGFDGLDLAASFKPQIATVDRDYATVCETSFVLAYQLAQGRSEDQVINSSYHVVPAASCGCPDDSHSRRLRGRYFAIQHTFKSYFLAQTRLESDLLSARTLHDVMGVVEGALASLSTDSLALVVGDELLGGSGAGRCLLALAGLKADGMLCEQGSHCYARFPSSEILPASLLSDERLLVIYPLNHSKHAIGYLMVDDEASVMELFYIQTLVALLSNHIQSVLSEMRVAELNHRLDELYMHDQLTGLYNRFGLEREGVGFYRRLQHAGRDVALAFVDIDDMKSINDTYGHEGGDEALKEVAEALGRIDCPHGSFAMRYGGDEFLAIADARDLAYLEGVERLVAEVHAEHGSAFALGVSVGTHVARRDDGLGLLQEIERADAAMYRLKREHHKRVTGTRA